MNVRLPRQFKKPLFLACVWALLGLNLLPFLRIAYFIPFLICTFYRYSLVTSIWFSLLVGIIVGVWGGDFFFGLDPLAYALVSLLIYPVQKHFFEDQWMTLPIMTFLFSVLLTVVSFTLQSFSENPIPVSGAWLFVDGILMPIMDAIYSFVGFVLPIILWGNREPKRHGFILKRPN